MHTTHPSPRGTRDASVAAVLEDAARYLDTYGWCQHNLTEEVSGTLPRACLVGAIYAVTHGTDQCHCRPVYTCPFTLAVDYLADFLDDGIWRDDQTPPEVVWAFNDHDDTTKDLVLHALRAAAKRARIELADVAVAS